ncbi:Nitrate reductase [Frankliniella fusca]|uniref:Nitrate reductase n=1 Tax=Frankliniella fusca TaxID=407009 RepID=A0AAE1H9J1_9NEOP|nr:Nitrate reductase [Frankliniella fusca]
MPLNHNLKLSIFFPRGLLWMYCNEVREMSQLERVSNKNKILNYNRLTEIGMSAPKPVIVTGCSSRSSKRHHSDNGCDSSPKKSKRMKKSRKAKSPLSRKDAKSHSKKDDISHMRRSKSKDKPKQAIEEDLRPYQSSSLTNTEQAKITAFLENPLNRKFSIPALLELNDDEALNPVIATLNSEGILFGKNLSEVLDYLVNHLYEMASDPNNVTAELREAMAVSLVACFPKFGQPMGEDSNPWSWLYNRKHNTGKLANIVAHRQTKQKSRLRGGGTREKKKPPQVKERAPKLSAIHEMQLSVEARFLRALLNVDTSRKDIELGMKNTFMERRKIIESQDYTNCAVIDAWPHLKSFRGEMIDLEFGLLHPEQSKNLIKNFHTIVLPLLKLAENKEKFPSVQFYSDVTLQAMIVLSQFLPKPKRCYDYETSMNPIPDINDFLQIVPVGSNVQYEINEKRTKSKHPIQPYLLGVGTEKKIESIILVLGDSQSVQLPPGVQVLKAIDLLVKAHYVLNTHYVLGWKNVYRFLEVHMYKLKPSGSRLSTFTEHYLQMVNMQCNQ